MTVHTEEMVPGASYTSPRACQPTLVIVQQGDLHRSALPVGLALSLLPAANLLEAERISLEMPCCVLFDFDFDPESTTRQLGDLRNDWIRLSCVACSEDTSVRNIVTAMRAGCVDFVPKPIQSCSLMAAAAHAFRIDSAGEYSLSQFRARLATLSDREAEVLRLFVDGQNTKVIAKQLGVSYQTIDKHRNRALKKMHVNGLIDLTRILNGEADCLV